MPAKSSEPRLVGLGIYRVAEILCRHGPHFPPCFRNAAGDSNYELSGRMEPAQNQSQLLIGCRILRFSAFGRNWMTRP